MAKAKSKMRAKGTMKGRIVKLFQGTQTLSTRDVFARLNKGSDKTTIAEVRRVVHGLVSGKQLKVAKVVKRQFTLGKGARWSK